MSGKTKKICFIVTSPLIVYFFLRNHFKKLSEQYEITLICNFNQNERDSLLSLNLSNIIYVPISREINILKDILVLGQLVYYFRQNKFNSTHSISPKAGLLASIAGWLAGITVRIHIFTGQVWSSKKGIPRSFLRLMDKVIVNFSTDILIDGYSQKKFLSKEKVISGKNSIVFEKGSISGVDIKRFNFSLENRIRIRTELKCNENEIVFIFLGRIKRAKGILDLANAFKKLSSERSNVYLLIVGYDEESLIKEIDQIFDDGKRVHYYGSTPTPEEILSAADVFCLPSYREGFGTSVLEASSCGLPIICSNTYGLEDTMIENITGLRHKIGDVENLFERMKELTDNKELRQFLGKNGREYVVKNFSAELITDAWIKFYKEKLNDENPLI